eukprot:Anaeramoba_ignava/a609194_26.p4 GENE.a609194_26~~a609194_26.p4  ORF type:complete len:107 (-),score=30.62 a609194_26:169-489(-)
MGVFSFGMLSLGIVSLGQVTAGVCVLGQLAFGTLFGTGQLTTGYYVFAAMLSISSKYGKDNKTGFANKLVEFPGDIAVWIILSLIFIIAFTSCVRKVLRKSPYKRD